MPFSSPLPSHLDGASVAGVTRSSDDRKGKGLNSIPVRFALISAVLGSCTLVAALRVYLFEEDGTLSEGIGFVLLALCVVLQSTLTFLAARKLTANILMLRRSTEAIIAGNMDHPVSVDCACEVGGLADSFRAMVARLNSNLLRINVLAYTDQVTGLPNRAVVLHALQQLASAGRDGACGVLFIDLDGFKVVNDSFGHDAGDDLLRQVADRIVTSGLGINERDLETCMNSFGALRETRPAKPVIARFAGDEFVVILPGETDPAEIRTHADRIRDVLRMPFEIANSEVRISASIGTARMPDDSAEADRLLSFADLAMYAAKQAGKNQVATYVPALSDAFAQRTALETDLRLAIERGELLLHYQPKFDSHDLSISGVEALVRWKHPQRGMIQPDQFITLAEQAGLMHELGRRVIRLAAAQCRQWVDEGRPRRISVNVSPTQFTHPGFVTELLDALASNDVPPGLFEIEITESTAMLDAEAIDQRLDAIRKAGIGIAIDDFGTGFSNLSQLSRLPFDELKIDRSLIREVGHSEKSQRILQAIVTMAHALGHRVVAEGIESLDQYAVLKVAGCDEIQGFLLARPMDAEALSDWELARDASPVEAIQTSLQRSLRRSA